MSLRPLCVHSHESLSTDDGEMLPFSSVFLHFFLPPKIIHFLHSYPTVSVAASASSRSAQLSPTLGYRRCVMRRNVFQTGIWLLQVVTVVEYKLKRLRAEKSTGTPVAAQNSEAFATRRTS